MASKDATQLLVEATDGSVVAIDALFQACYQELGRLARGYLAREKEGHTLQTGALVHEAYLRMVDAPQLAPKNRAHFMAISARVMRQILVDHARRHLASKRTGKRQKLSLDEALTIGADEFNTDLIALDIALTKLQQEQPEKAQVVEMRFFAGMNTEEIAEALGVTDRTVRRYLAYAQARLYKDMRSGLTDQ